VLNVFASLALVAIAGAVSTVPVSLTIMILLSPNPRHGALPFLVGSLAGSVVIVGLSAVGLQLLPMRPKLNQHETVAMLGVLIGTFLVGYGIFLFGHGKKTESAVLSKIRSKFRSARTWEFAALGLGLNLRPKALLLAVTAGAMISVRDPQPLAGAVSVLAYAALAQSAVVVPIVIWLRSPERSEVQLTALYAWLQRNGHTIAASVTLGIGVFIAVYSALQL
jgi:hypothetical protein